MKTSTISTIGKALTSLACLLPIGCATTQTTLPTNPNQSTHQITQESPNPSDKDYQNPSQNQPQESNQPKLSAYSWEKFGDMVFGSGRHIGPFPSATNKTGVVLENKLGSIDAWRFSVFDNHGKHVNEEYGLTGKLNLTDNLTLLTSLEDWPVNGHTTVGVLGVNYNNNGFNAELKTRNDLSDGGTLYIGTFSQKLTENYNLTAQVRAAYSDTFLNGLVPRGWMHITPNLSADLGDIGPLHFSGNIGYQFSLDESRDSFLLGAVTVGFKTPKIELGGEK